MASPSIHDDFSVRGSTVSTVGAARIQHRAVPRWLAAALVCSLLLGPYQQVSPAAVVTTKSGMQFRGKVTKIGSLNENPLNPNRTAGAVDVKPIVILDDELRWVFIPNQ